MSPEKEKIGFIGDSITRSRNNKGDAVDAEMAILKNYTAINQGKSGSTSTDWLPGYILFDDALAIFKTQNVHTVSIMLGTNDSRVDRRTSPATYRRNMERIAEGLIASGVVRLVIINYPPYAVPGSFNRWDSMSTTYVQLYEKQLNELTQERGVVRGDSMAFAYFKYHPYELADGVHPNATGNETLGKLWARAYQNIMSSEAAKRRSSAIANVFYRRT
jgi:lysophospholipase L1-like esterase